jgi:hypothetical protein
MDNLGNEETVANVNSDPEKEEIALLSLEKEAVEDDPLGQTAADPIEIGSGEESGVDAEG